MFLNISAMATLQYLDSTNFFDGGNPEKRTCYDSHQGVTELAFYDRTKTGSIQETSP
jgi:hypothetical protein